MKLKTFIFRILIGLVLIVLGILTFVQSANFIKILTVICGLFILGASLFEFFSFSSYGTLFSVSSSAKTMSLVSNIAGAAFGLFAIIAPFAWAKVVGLVLAWIIALYLFYSCFVSFRIFFGLKKAKAEFVPKNLLVEGLCSLLFALLLIIAPNQAGKAIFIVIGVVLISAGSVVTALTISDKFRTKNLA